MQTYAPVLEAFCNGARAEVGLINAVQVHCYTDTRVMKAFPQILKVLYNADCISDQAILYWHSKGAKPQGKQHFLKVTEPLVKVSQRSHRVWLWLTGSSLRSRIPMKSRRILMTASRLASCIDILQQLVSEAVVDPSSDQHHFALRSRCKWRCGVLFQLE